MVRAIEALNLCVGLLVERFEAVNQSEAEWEVIESEIPGGYPKAKDLQKTHWGGVEDPPDVPSFAFSLGKRLTGADVGAETPVRRAFVAGFHAKIAIDIHTNYEEKPPLALGNTQWVVVRGSALGRLIRVPTKRDLGLAIAGASNPVYQGFASATEAFIFCIGCGIQPPSIHCSDGEIISEVCPAW